MTPKVSVITCCYNQEDTVIRSIKSIREQECSFGIQHIIVDDGSTDGTLRELSNVSIPSKTPTQIMFCSNNHKGMLQSYESGFNHSWGEYIAFCDGDDYWIDPLKLQKQVDYMDEHPECALCITKVKVQKEGSDELIPMSVDARFINRVISFDSILMGNAYIHAQSYLLRTAYFKKNIDFSYFIKKKFIVWDLPIVLEIVKNSCIHCLDFYSAVFYKKKESATNTHSRIKRLRYILGMNKIKWYFIKKYNCQSTTKFYLVYRFIRDIYSVIFRRW